MKPKLILKTPVLILTTCALSIVLTAWNFKQQPSGIPQQTESFYRSGHPQDTVPKVNRDRKIRDLDDVLDQLEKSKLEMESSLRNIDFDRINRDLKESMKNIDGQKMKLEMQRAMKDIDFEKINQELKESMKNIDVQNMKLEMQKAMQNVDFDKINNELKESMSNIDAQKMKLDMEKAMKGIDFDKIQLNMEKAMASIDMEKMKQSIERIKSMDFEKMEMKIKEAELNLKDMGPKLENQLEKARVKIDESKAKVQEYKSFVDALEKDGLINKKGNYSIKHTDGQLLINEKKQPIDVYTKYKSFLEKHKKFTIEKSSDDFNIDMD